MTIEQVEMTDPLSTEERPRHRSMELPKVTYIQYIRSWLKYLIQHRGKHTVSVEHSSAEQRIREVMEYFPYIPSPVSSVGWRMGGK